MLRAGSHPTHSKIAHRGSASRKTLRKVEIWYVRQVDHDAHTPPFNTPGVNPQTYGQPEGHRSPPYLPYTQPLGQPCPWRCLKRCPRELRAAGLLTPLRLMAPWLTAPTVTGGTLDHNYHRCPAFQPQNKAERMTGFVDSPQTPLKQWQEHNLDEA